MTAPLEAPDVVLRPTYQRREDALLHDRRFGTKERRQQAAHVGA